MLNRNDMSSSLVIGAAKPLPGGEGLGWGSEAAWPSVKADVEPTHPQPLSTGEGSP